MNNAKLKEIRNKSFVGTNGDGRLMITEMKKLNSDDIEFLKENKQEILSILKEEKNITKESELQAKKDYSSYKREERNFNTNNGHS